MANQQVDNKIVQMQFDNSNFEKNVQNTINSLNQLNDRLKLTDGSKGIDAVQARFDKFTTMKVEKGLVHVQDHFSTLNTVAFATISNLTNEVVNFGKKLVKNVINPLTSGGMQRALNIGQANFQLAGLNIEKGAADSYKQVMNAVLGTAYSYDVAAKAASQLAASQVGVEKSTKVLLNGSKKTVKTMNHDMYDAILGIAGVASMTGSSFEEISNIFTRVAGQGRVMATDLNSISARGINAAATLGEYLGKTESEVRELVSDGKISFEIFSNAMTKAFGEHAKDSTKTFSGAIEDMKAALSRIGADYYTPYLEGSKRIINSFTPIIDTIHDKLKPALDSAGKSLLNRSKQIVGILNNINFSMNLSGDIGKDFSVSSNLIQNGINTIINSTKKLKGGSVDVIDMLSKHLNKTKKETKELVKTSQISMSDWLSALRNYDSDNEKVTSKINTYLADTTKKMKELEKVADSLNITNDAVSKGMDILIKKFGDTKVYNAIGEKLNITGKTVKKSVEEGTLSLTDFRTALEEIQAEGGISQKMLNKVTSAMDDMILSNSKLNESIKGTKLIFMGLSNIFNSIRTIFKTFSDSFNQVFSKNKNGKLLDSFGQNFYNLTEKIKITEERAKALGKVFVAILKPIKVFVDFIKKSVTKALDFGSLFTGFNFSELQYMLWDASDYIRLFIDKVKKAFNSLRNMDLTGGIVDNVKNIFSKVVEYISSLLNTGKNSVIDFKDGVIETFNSIIDNIKNIFENIIQYVKNLYSTIFRQIKARQEINSLYDKPNASEMVKSGVNASTSFFNGFNKGLSKNFSSFKSTISKKAGATEQMVEAGKESAAGYEKGFFDVASNMIGGIIDFFMYLLSSVKSVLGIHSPSKKFEEVGKNSAEGYKIGFIDNINNARKDIVSSISKIITDVSNSLGSSSIWNKLFKGAIATGSFYLMKRFMASIKGMLNPLEAFDDALDSISFVLTRKGQELRAEAIQKYTESVKTIAEALLILSGALFIIGNIPTDKLKKGLGVLTVLVAIMTGYILVLRQLTSAEMALSGSLKDKTFSFKSKDSITGILLGMGASVLMIAIAFKTIAKECDENPIKKIASFIIVLSSVLGYFFVLGKIIQGNKFAFGIKGKKGINPILSASKALIEISFALILLSHAMKSLSKLKKDEILKSGEIITGFFAVISLFQGALTLMSKQGRTKISDVNLLQYAGAIYLMTIVIKRINKLTPEEIGKGLLVVLGIEAVFAVLIGALQFISNEFPSKGRITKVEGVILAISVSMILISQAIKTLAKLDANAMYKAVGVISVLTVLFGVIIFLSSNFEALTNNKMFTSNHKDALKTAVIITTITIALGVMAASVAILSQIDTKKLWKAVGAISVLMAVLGVLFLVAAKIEAKNLKTLNTVVIMLGIVAGLLVFLTIMDPSDYLPAIIGLSAVLGALSLALLAAGRVLKILGKQKAQLIKGLTTAGEIILILGSLFGLFYGFVKLTEKINSDKIKDAAESISMLLLALSVSIAIMNKFTSKVTKANLKTQYRTIIRNVSYILLILGSIELLFGAFLVTMKYFGVKGDSMLKAAESLSMLGVVFTAIALVLSKFEDFKIKDKTMISSYSGIISKVCGMLAGIVISFGAFMIAMTEANVNGNDMIAGAKAISIIASTLGVLVILLTKIRKNKIVNSDKKLVSNLDKIIGKISLLMLSVAFSFGLFMSAMGYFNVSTNSLIKGALAFSIVLGAVTLVIGALIGLSALLNNANSRKVSKITSSLTVILTSISALLAVVSIFFGGFISMTVSSGATGSSLVKGAEAFSIVLAALSGMIGILIGMSAILSHVKPSKIVKITSNLKTIILSISALFTVSSVIFALSMSLMSFAGLSGKEIITGAKAFTILLGALVGVIAAMTVISLIFNKIPKKNIQKVGDMLSVMSKYMNGMIIPALITFIAGMSIMSKFGVTGDEMIKGAEAFSGIAVVLSIISVVLMGITSKLSKIDTTSLKGATSKILLITGAMTVMMILLEGTFAHLMIQMSKNGLNGNEIIKGAEAFSIIIAGLIGMIASLTLLSKFITPATMANIGTLSIAMAGLEIVISWVFGSFATEMSKANISGSNLVKMATSLAIAINSLIPVFTAIALLSPILSNPAAWIGMGAGIVAFDLFVVSLAASISGATHILLNTFEKFGELASPRFKENLSEGLGMVETLYEGLGRIKGAIVAGFMTKTGEALNSVLDTLVPLIERISAIPNIENASETLRKLIQALGSFNNQGLKFDSAQIEGLSDIGRELKDFIESMGSLSNQQLRVLDISTKALSRVGSFMKVAKYLNSDDMFDTNAYDKVSKFSLYIKGAKDIVTTLQDFYKNISFSGNENVESGVDVAIKALNALSIITKAMKGATEYALDAHSGFFDNMQFKTYIKGMKDSLVGLLDFMESDIFNFKKDNSNSEAIFNRVKAAVKATKAIKILSDACKNLDTGWQWNANTVERLKGMGNSLGELGLSLTEFADNVPEVKSGVYTKMNEAVKILKKLSDVSRNLSGYGNDELIPDYTALIPKIKQSTSGLRQLSDDMVELGDSLTKFADDVSGFNEDDLNAVSLAADALGAIGKSMKEFNGLGDTDFATGKDGGGSGKTVVDYIEQYSEILPQIGTSFASFTNSMTSFTKDGKSITNSTEQVDQAIKALNSLSGLAKSTEDYTNLSELGTSLSDAIESLGTVKVEDATSAGEVISNFVNSFNGSKGVDGISKMSTLLSSFNEFSSDGLGNLGKAIYSVVSSFSDEGNGETREFNLLKDTQRVKDAGNVIQTFISSITKESITKLTDLLKSFNADFDTSKFEDFGTNFSKMIEGFDTEVDAETAGGLLKTFMDAFGTADEAKDDIDNLNDLIHVMNSVDSEKFGDFGTNFDTLVSTIGKEYTDGTPAKAAENLSEFINNLTIQNGGKSSKTTTNSLTSLIDNLVTIAGKITENSDVFTSGKFTSGLEGMEALMSSISDFTDKFDAYGSDVRADQITQKLNATNLAVEAVKTLAIAADSLDNSFFKDAVDKLQELGLLLPELGNDINNMVTNLPEIGDGNYTKIDKAVNFITKMAEISQSLKVSLPTGMSTSGIPSGLQEKLNQGKSGNLYTLASTFSELGKAIKDFADQVKDFGTDRLKDVETASNALSALGEALKIFNEIDLQMESQKASADAAKEKVDSAGSLNGIFAGMDWDNLETNLDKIQEASGKLKETLDVLDGIDSERMTVLTEFMNIFTQDYSSSSSLGTAITSLSKDTNIMAASLAGQILNNFITNLPDDFTNLNSFISTVNTADTSKFESFGKNYGKLIKELSESEGNAKTAANKINNFASNIDATKIATDLQDKLEGLDLDLTSMGDKWSGYGESLVKSFASGITGKLGAVTQAFADINKLKKYAQSGGTVYNYWKTMGKWLTQGFAVGILDKKATAAVNAAAVKIGTDAGAKLKAAIKTNSPSKLTMKYGKSFTEGFALGITSKNMVAKVNDAVYGMSLEATNSLQNAINLANEMIDSVDVSNPVITPIVDLDNVYAATDIMSNILDLNPSAGVGATIANANAVLLQNRQNGNNNDDVVNAIGGLKDKLDNVSQTNNYIGEVKAGDNDAISQAIEQLVNVCIVEGRA